MSLRHSVGPSAIYSDSIKPLSVLHSGLKREWWPIFSFFHGQNIYIKELLCNFLVRTLKYF